MAGVSACSDDGTPTPVGPVAYRLTLHTTDPAHPTRTVSAIIDWNESLFVAGMNGTEATISMSRAGDIWGAAGQLPSLSFTLPQPSPSHLPRAEALLLRELKLRPSEHGCTGQISASVQTMLGDMVHPYDVSADFDCVEDRVGPVFIAGNQTAAINPVDLRWIGADEHAMLSGASLVDVMGTAISLAPIARSPSAWGSTLFDVSAALAFGSTYTLVASGTDVAGNPVTSPTQVSTDPDPGVFAQDGFEGPIHAVTTDLVTIVDATVQGQLGMPAKPAIPSGQRAIGFGKLWSGNAFARFTARLQAPATATAVKVTYVRVRGTAPDATATPPTYPESHIVWTVAIPNSTAIAAYDKDQAPVLTEPRPWTVGPAAQGATGWYSEPQTLTFPLPAPAVGGEVLFDVLTDQFIASGDGAFILDDLRVE